MRVPWLLLAAVWLGLAAPVSAAESEAVRSPRATVTLVSDTDAISPGVPLRVALRLRLEPGWHTYWKNPGDAGAPAEIFFRLPAGMTAGEIAWPAPERLPEGPLMTFGYTGEVLLPVTLTPGAAAGQIEAQATWLACEKICVPEEGIFRLLLPAGSPGPAREAPLFVAADRAMPRPLPWPARIAADGVLAVQSPEISRATVADAWFMPDLPGVIEHSAAQLLATGADGLRLALTPASEFKPAAALAGLLTVVDRSGQRVVFSVAAAPGLLEVGTTDLPALPLLRAIAFAFLGGLILNLMPCVFPVLAMKAVSLAGLSGTARAAARRGALFYTLGVLMAFAVLAGALLAARSVGAAAGWGFQFQSPVFVAVMAWLLFAIGLNLSGVFAIEARLAGAGQNFASRGGVVGNFATGLLAAIVATPCTAPFMGAAIAAALGASVPVAIAVFLAMGLGLAAPYVVLAVTPGFARLMPRPGPWMDFLRQALAFPMYAASGWLVWVMSQSLGPPGVLVTVGGFLLVGLAARVFGGTQNSVGARPRRIGAGLAVVALLLAVALLPALSSVEPAVDRPVLETGADRFSAARLADLRAEGRPVFVNMTAAWCITCLVNERVALAPDAVRRQFAQRRIVYLKGDWTRQDPEITAFLRQHGRDGVPLYVFYPPRGPAIVLPQILTEGIVLDVLARGGGA